MDTPGVFKSEDHDLVERVVLDARGFAEVHDFEDDVTMVLLRRAA